ncbi:MAG: SpoIIE family protein phosphatase [Acidimicrobiales bacterium]
MIGADRSEPEAWPDLSGYTESAEDLYENAPCGYVTNEASGHIGRVNRRFVDLVGYRATELVGRRRFSELLTKPGRVFYETHLRPLLDNVGAFTEMALDLVAADGTRRPVLVNAATHVDDLGRSIYRFVIVDARERRAYEQELLAERRSAERLAELSATILQADSSAALANAVAELGPAVFAARFAAVLFSDGGELRDPAASEMVGDAEIASALAGRGEVLDAYRFGRASFDVASCEVESCIEGEARQTVWAVPLREARTIIGVLVAGYDGERAAPARAPRLMEFVALQLAVAAHRLTLQAQQRAISLQLQQALLPRTINSIPSVDVAAGYRPATASVEVGGDWHDTYVFDDGRVGWVIGDVVGHGIEAAAVMGSLRSAFGALAPLASGPADALDKLHDFAHTSGCDFSTACCAMLDPVTGELRYAYAGHPPILLLGADGTTTFLDGAAAPLYGPRHRPRTDRSVTLAAGDAVLLYTDGLVEQGRRCISDGLTRLARCADQLRQLSADRFTHQLLETLAAEGPFGDDVALLCCRLVAHERLCIGRPAEPTALRDIRQALRWWCRHRSISDADQQTLQLLVGELATNSIEHGHRATDAAGEIMVELTLTNDDTVHARVEDNGRWHDAPTTGRRGWGLRLLRHMGHDVRIDRTAIGTRVSFTVPVRRVPPR